MCEIVRKHLLESGNSQMCDPELTVIEGHMEALLANPCRSWFFYTDVLESRSIYFKLWGWFHRAVFASDSPKPSYDKGELLVVQTTTWMYNRHPWVWLCEPATLRHH